jgi:hypothetical protein
MADIEEFNVHQDWDRRDAFVIAFSQLGNVPKAAAMAGVTQASAYKWCKSEWFKKQMRDLVRQQNKGLDTRITGILDTCLSNLVERLDKGDERVFASKDGPVRMHVPVPAKDLAVITGVLFDKRNQLRKEQDPEDSSAESALDRIADRLRQYELTDKLRGKSEVIDVEPKEGEDLC